MAEGHRKMVDLWMRRRVLGPARAGFGGQWAEWLRKKVELG